LIGCQGAVGCTGCRRDRRGYRRDGGVCQWLMAADSIARGSQRRPREPATGLPMSRHASYVFVCLLGLCQGVGRRGWWSATPPPARAARAASATVGRAIRRRCGRRVTEGRSARRSGLLRMRARGAPRRRRRSGRGC
jgi:hypothetical protein